MRSILIVNDSSQQDLLLAELWEVGMEGAVEEENGLRVFFDDEIDIAPLRARYESLILETREEQPHDWELVSREGWDPILAGSRFFIVPPWLDQDPPPGRMKIVIDAGMAFGTGRHESTQLMIEALETHVRPGAAVLDVGCGSGILSGVADLLGAGLVTSCDVNPDSVDKARTHIQSPLYVGSADAVKDSAFDIVAVNISAAVIDALAADLRRVAKPSGLLILAGFIDVNPPKNIRADHVLQLNEWQCWVCSSRS